tara:strand:+ start:127 stop:423 length:297 start_codon:yes stop_codon:yes gene_type:complete
MTPLPFFSDKTIYALARRLFEKAPGDIREIGIHCYELEPIAEDQMSLFQDQLVRERQVTEAVDTINRQFGERTIHSAHTLGTGHYVKQKIPFGSTRYL